MTVNGISGLTQLDHLLHHLFDQMIFKEDGMVRLGLLVVIQQTKMVKFVELLQLKLVPHEHHLIVVVKQFTIIMTRKVTPFMG